jgi:hypothetical protein
MPSVRARYRPRAPERDVLRGIIASHFETFRERAAGRRDGEGLPRFVDREFHAYVGCGTLAGGFARLTASTPEDARAPTRRACHSPVRLTRTPLDQSGRLEPSPALTAFAVASPPTSVKVVVYDYGADLSGATVLPIRR